MHKDVGNLRYHMNLTLEHVDKTLKDFSRYRIEKYLLYSAGVLQTSPSDYLIKRKLAAQTKINPAM